MSSRYSMSSFDAASYLNKDQTLRPCTPPLDRAPTPTSISSPPTPTYQPASPAFNKSSYKSASMRNTMDTMSPLSSSAKQPGPEERSVMRAFASHANHCTLCNDPLMTHLRHGKLCARGVEYTKDLRTYFYIISGRPYSRLEHMRGHEGVEVEIPAEYSAVKRLVEALSQGFKVEVDNHNTTTPAAKPQVHQYNVRSESTKRASPSRRYTDYPITSANMTTSYTDELDDTTAAYEVRDAQSNSRRRRRQTVYRSPSGRYIETRSPLDSVYTGKPAVSSPTSTTPRTTTTTTIPISIRKPIVEQRSHKKTASTTSSDLGSVPSVAVKATTTRERSSSWDTDDRKSRSDREVRFYGYEAEPRKVRRQSTYMPFQSGLLSLLK